MPYSHVAIRIIKDGELFATYKPNKYVGMGFLEETTQDFVTSIHAKESVVAIVYNTRTMKELFRKTRWIEKENDEAS